MPSLKDILHLLHREQRMLALFFTVTSLVLMSLIVASKMLDGETLALDHKLLTVLRLPGNLAEPVGPPWLREAMIDITALGGITVLTMISVLAIAALLLLGRFRSAAFAALATGGGALAGSMLKTFFARARPDMVPHLVEVNSLSFPSSHALNGAIVYLTLAIILARALSSGRLRLFVVGVATMLVLLIGISRIYLGVHFPSDVLAGWSFGAGWALAMGLVANGLNRLRIPVPPNN